jgi:hypothetical protein
MDGHSQGHSFQSRMKISSAESAAGGQIGKSRVQAAADLLGIRLHVFEAAQRRGRSGACAAGDAGADS